MTYKKPYHFRKIRDTFIVVGLSHERIDTFLHEIAQYLLAKNFSGPILFDLLLSNGNNSRRFFKADFKEGEIVLKSIKKQAIVDSEIEQFLYSFYSKHKGLLRNGVLTTNERERVIEQIERGLSLQTA